ncbi:MAG TPA: formylglycine-generating enzyme family protein [Verrucomicrobiae bacterium]|nr:formylglycine-generating enzyme family protein [Verrucomicrobiae bacterium]
MKSRPINLLLVTLGIAVLFGLSLSEACASSPSIAGMNIVGGNLHLNITSDVGLTNQIQTATDLTQASWSVVTNLVVTQSNYWFAVPVTSSASQCFYRVLAIPVTSTNPGAPQGMVLIAAGTFQMGDTFAEGATWELPVHDVYVSSFYMDKFEVTKGLWDRVKTWSAANGYTYDNDGAGKATNHPVESINWYDMVKWCNARSQMEGRTPAYYTDAGLTQIYKTGQVEPFVKWNAAAYRLPTEAEWEKGDRGGTPGHRFPWSDTDTITHSRANYYSDSSYPYDVSPTRGYNPAFENGAMPYTSPVGSFAPNGYGLYDTAGNVWEWCWDYAGNYSSAPATDPHGPDSGSTRVGKGGNWNFYAEHCRASYRYGNAPTYTATNIGFRCAMTAP